MVIILIELRCCLKVLSAKDEAVKGIYCFAVLSGILCGLRVSGCASGAYLSRVTDDSHAFKGIFAVYFYENTFRIILYSCWGNHYIRSRHRRLCCLCSCLAVWGLEFLQVMQDPRKIVKRLVIILFDDLKVVLIFREYMR